MESEQSKTNLKENKQMAVPVPYKEMMDTHELFLKEKKKLLSAFVNTKEPKEKGDTEHIWFEMTDELRTTLKALAELKEVSGIRFYLCSYDSHDSPLAKPSKKEFAFQTTIGFVATRKQGNKHPDYWEDEQNKIILVVPPPQNHGELSPPSTTK